jgi:AraC-like DNA-binding protein
MPAIAELAQQPGADIFESTDPGHTEAYLTANHGSPVKIDGAGGNYHFWQASHRFGQLQLVGIDDTATSEYRAEPLPTVMVVRMARGIRTRIDVDDHWGPGELGLHQPNQLFHVRFTPTRYSVAMVSMQALADAGRNRPDDDLGSLHFGSLRPAHSGGARHWLQTVHYITQSLRSQPDAMAQPLLSGAATRMLATALLTTFPNTWTSEPHHHDRTDATPTALSRAIAFIESNADLDISIVDIARAAYVTVRAVQFAFRRQLDTTPMAYLRRVRLERAHVQLRDATAGDGTTITQVAARWGFADPSRFTARYRRTYGQPPSQTLRT